MPKGDNPNSRAALAAGKTDFRAGTARTREAAIKGNKSPVRKTNRLFKDILKDALAQKLKDEKVIERLQERGVLAEGEIDLKTAITYVAVLKEMDDPTPGGMERMAKLLGEIEEEQTGAASITINVPTEYRA